MKISFLLLFLSCSQLFCCHSFINSDDIGLAKNLYYENKIEEAVDILKNIVEEQPSNIDALIWLAQSYYRLRDNNNAARYSKKVLELDECNSFAHIVYGNSILPDFRISDPNSSDISWSHFTKAVKCDSTNFNGWIEIWGESIRRQDEDSYRQSIKKLYETKFFTPAMLEYGRWLLKNLPENSLLITNGDMDTFPVQAIQAVEKFRPDVVIVEWGLLELEWSLKFLRDFCDVPISLSDSEIKELTHTNEGQDNYGKIAPYFIDSWINKIKQNIFTRPLVFAPSVDPALYEKYNDDIRFAGSYLIFDSSRLDSKNNLKELLQNLDGIKKQDFSGTWVNPKDLSPIRTIYNKHLIKNVTYSVIILCEKLIEDERLNDALKILEWVETFEHRSELGESFSDDIERLKQSCNKNIN